MRTTLEIDDTVLAAARSLAANRGVSLGAAVSELARRGLQTQSPVVEYTYAPFPVIVGDPLIVVTDELVAELRDD